MLVCCAFPARDPRTGSPMTLGLGSGAFVTCFLHMTLGPGSGCSPSGPSRRPCRSTPQRDRVASRLTEPPAKHPKRSSARPSAIDRQSAALPHRLPCGPAPDNQVLAIRAVTSVPGQLDHAGLRVPSSLVPRNLWNRLWPDSPTSSRASQRAMVARPTCARPRVGRDHPDLHARLHRTSEGDIATVSPTGAWYAGDKGQGR